MRIICKYAHTNLHYLYIFVLFALICIILALFLLLKTIRIIGILFVNWHYIIMKILILNWRDLKNPEAGGAEIVTHQIAKRLVLWGNRVTLFCAQFPGGKNREKIDGIEVFRKGRQFTVHWHAYRYYKKYFQGKFDLVIDEINTIPFFTTRYVKEKKVAFIHQLAREVWWYEAPFPISLLGYLLEPLYLKFYKKVSIITVSNSTKKDLIKLGFKEENINIIPEGLDFKPINSLEEIKKEKSPLLLYFGSVRPMKRVDQVVKSIIFIKKEIPNIQLYIAGGGDDKYIKKIKKIVSDNNLVDNVKFLGRVEENQKRKIMSRSHLILVTSIREGWGLVIIEASACGTPAVVYNAPGLVDAVKDGETGIVCKKNTPFNLAENVIKLLKNKDLYKKTQKNTWEWSKEFNWEKPARKFLEILNK